MTVTSLIDSSGSAIDAVTMTATATITSIIDSAGAAANGDFNLPSCSASDAKYEKTKKAAIGVGVSMGAIAVAASAAFIWALYKKRRVVMVQAPIHNTPTWVAMEKETPSASTHNPEAPARSAPISPMRSSVGTLIPTINSISVSELG
ncbi:MAG: hypothetical protein MMC23_007006 [Stictis urceolatum]|nr:hypothetical protein [Stictis urceolata]